MKRLLKKETHKFGCIIEKIIPFYYLTVRVNEGILKNIFLLILLFSLFSCTKKEGKKEFSLERKPTYGDTIIEASIGDASLLNPVLASDSASASINNLVYNGLVKYNKNLKLVGDLAEKWKVSSDGKIIIFFLRRNVHWHDGKPFTAEDVNFTYKKLVDPSVRTPYSADYERISSVQILDDYTIKIVYREPFSPALESWGIGIVPKHIFSVGDFNTNPANRKPVGTGPYIFKEWRSDEKIVLEANPDYFEGKPYIQRVIYRIIPDQAVQLMELKRESIDMMGLTPYQYQKETITSNFMERFNKFRYPSFGYTYLGYNLRNPLFKDKRVRQALSYAINKEEIIEVILHGLGKRATGPFPPSSWAYNPNVKEYRYNPKKARQLLKQAGWKDTDNDGVIDKDGVPFSFVILTNQGNKMRELSATIIQENLRKIGIDVKIRIIEWSSFIHQYIDKRNFEAVLLGWSLSYDPDCFSIWHSSQIGEGKYNFISYSNKRVDRLLAQGRRVFDLDKRKRIYYEIHRILADEQPYTFLYVSDSLPVVHRRFKGIKVEKAGIGYNFIKWYVPKSQQRYMQ